VYFSDNYDSNIGHQRYVNIKKFTFEIDDVWKCCRQRDTMLTCWWRHQLNMSSMWNTH